MNSVEIYTNKVVNEVNKNETNTKMDQETNPYANFFVGDYEISGVCLQTYPCQHSIRKKNQPWKRLFGHEIYMILRSNGLQNEHFNKYGTFATKYFFWPIRFFSFVGNKINNFINNVLLTIEKTLDRLDEEDREKNLKKTNTYRETLKLNKFEGSNYFVGEYEINGGCSETYPCQHSIRKNNEPLKYMFGHEIYLMFKNEGLKDEHFDKYEEFIKIRDCPVEQAKRKQIEKKLELKNKEHEDLINNYKASLKLDVYS